MAKHALEGIRVLEISTGAAGPTLGRVLGEFGAEVIRIETRLRSDGHRGEKPDQWNKRPDFVKLHRGKKSFTVNMKTEKGCELVKSLVRKCDVLVENYGLGVVERWGLDYPQVKELNPACIVVRVKGLGCTGPHATDLTWGPNVANLNGSTYLWNHPGASTPTAEPRSQHPDFMGGVTGAFAVVLALIHRKKTGRGQWIDSAQLEIGASVLGPRYLEYSVNGREPEPEGNRSVAAAPYGAYRCKGDDRWCVITVDTQDKWERFCALRGAPDVARHGRFSTHLERVRHREELDLWVEEWTRQHDPYEVMNVLQGMGIGAAVVQNVEDQFKHDTQYAATGFLIKTLEPEAGGVVTEGIPVRFSETPGVGDRPAPLMGEHTREIATGLLGLSEEEITALEKENVLV